MKLLATALVSCAAIFAVLATPALAVADEVGDTFELGPPSSPTTDPGEIASRRFHHSAEVAASGPRSVRVSAWCSTACRAEVRVRLGAGAAKRAGLGTLVATRSVRLDPNARDDITVNLGAKVSRALRAAGVGPGQLSTAVTFERLG